MGPGLRVARPPSGHQGRNTSVVSRRFAVWEAGAQAALAGFASLRIANNVDAS